MNCAVAAAAREFVRPSATRKYLRVRHPTGRVKITVPTRTASKYLRVAWSAQVSEGR